MIVNYENAKFKVSHKHSIEFHLIKQAIKKKIGRWIGKPFIKDGYIDIVENLIDFKKSATILDVGCNIGTTVLPLAIRHPNAKFFAFEPHPIPGSRFIKNCELNDIDNVSFFSCAIGEDKNLAKIYTCPNNSGGHRLTGFEGRKDLEKCKKTFGPISIPVICLNEIFSEFDIKYCDLLKIDTEGYEFSVLKSLSQYLKPNLFGYIIAEMGPESFRAANTSGWEMISFMIKNGFKCKVLGSTKEIKSQKDVPVLKDCTVTDLLFYS